MACRKIVNDLANGMTVLAGQDNAAIAGQADGSDCIHGASEVEIGMLNPIILQDIYNHLRIGVVKKGLGADQLEIKHGSCLII